MIQTFLDLYHFGEFCLPAPRGEHISEKRTQNANLIIVLLSLGHQPYGGIHGRTRMRLVGLEPGLACIFVLFFGEVPKYGFGHEADRQGHYRRKNITKFDVARSEPYVRRSEPGFGQQKRQPKFNFHIA